MRDEREEKEKEKEKGKWKRKEGGRESVWKGKKGKWRKEVDRKGKVEST